MAQVMKKSFSKLKEALIGTYKQISSDYAAAAKDTWVDAKSYPIRACFYSGSLVFGVYAYKTVPSEDNYQATLVKASNDLLLQSDGTRNKQSDNHVQKLLTLSAQDRLRYRHLGIFSIIYQSNYGRLEKSFRSQCKYSNPRWTEFHKRVVDFGFLSCWWNLKYTMTDYDIDFDELPKDFSNSFAMYWDNIKKLFGYSYYNHLKALPEPPKPYVFTPAESE